MFILYPTNADYVIPSVRLHVGDYDGDRFSNSVIRSAIINGITYLSRRWNARYLVVESGWYTPSGLRMQHGFYYQEEIDENVVPTTIIPSGFAVGRFPQGFAVVPLLEPNNVVRNPFVLQESELLFDPADEYAIVLAASMLLLRAYLTSSSDKFISWSDGEFSYSGIQANKTLRDLLVDTTNALEEHFKGRLADALIGA